MEELWSLALAWLVKDFSAILQTGAFESWISWHPYFMLLNCVLLVTLGIM